MTTVIPYDRALPEVPGRTPYTRPDQYLEKLGAGDYAVRHVRRPSTMFLVEKLRQAVDRWRDEGYPGISDVTRRLFQFWFEEDHLLADGSVWRYWWCQREALETLVYLMEVRRFPDVAPVAEEFGARPQQGFLHMEDFRLLQAAKQQQATASLQEIVASIRERSRQLDPEELDGLIEEARSEFHRLQSG